jgi:hypothetical protein
MGQYQTWKEFFHPEAPPAEQASSEKSPVVPSLVYVEVVLPDDYSIFAEYVYIVDGIFYRSPLTGTVAALKRVAKATEVRSCNLFAHGDAKIGDRVRAENCKKYEPEATP